MSAATTQCGRLALAHGQRLPLAALRSARGWYLGTADEDGPVTRESVEYFDTQPAAAQALIKGDWTQRDSL